MANTTNKLDMSDTTKRQGISQLFNELYVMVHGGEITDPRVDLNIAFLEDLICTSLGKLSNSALVDIQFQANSPIRIKLGTGFVLEDVDSLPMKSFINNAITVKRIPRASIVDYFNVVHGLFSNNYTRRNLELILSPMIVRVARRQDILYNKKPSIKIMNKSVDVNIKMAPLFRCQQTYTRFRSVISNHLGIGPLIGMIGSCTEDKYRKGAIAKLVDRLSNVHQKAAARDIYSNTRGLRMDVVNTLLESCFIFRPREQNAFIANSGFYCQNAREAYDLTLACYNNGQLLTVMCGTVPWCFVELLTTFGTVYDNLGVMEYMTGLSYRRSGLKMDMLKLLNVADVAVLGMNGGFLAPLKGSATGTSNMAVQGNTVISVHGKRKLLHEDTNWMESNAQMVFSTDTNRQLQLAMESKISKSNGSYNVCEMDPDLAISDIGFWNNSV